MDSIHCPCNRRPPTIAAYLLTLPRSPPSRRSDLPKSPRQLSSEKAGVSLASSTSSTPRRVESASSASRFRNELKEVQSERETFVKYQSSMETCEFSASRSCGRCNMPGGDLWRCSGVESVRLGVMCFVARALRITSRTERPNKFDGGKARQEGKV